jgi:hypothetical protein
MSHGEIMCEHGVVLRIKKTALMASNHFNAGFVCKFRIEVFSVLTAAQVMKRL